jgi:hypothetical protein
MTFGTLQMPANDYKDSKMDNEKGEKMFVRPASRQARRPSVALAVFLTGCFFIYLWTVSHSIHIHLGGGRTVSIELWTEKQLVPLEAHIMSKCPDAQVCPPTKMGYSILIAIRIVSG